MRGIHGSFVETTVLSVTVCTRNHGKHLWGNVPLLVSFSNSAAFAFASRFFLFFSADLLNTCSVPSIITVESVGDILLINAHVPFRIAVHLTAELVCLIWQQYLLVLRCATHVLCRFQFVQILCGRTRAAAVPRTRWAIGLRVVVTRVGTNVLFYEWWFNKSIANRYQERILHGSTLEFTPNSRQVQQNTPHLCLCRYKVHGLALRPGGCTRDGHQWTLWEYTGCGGLPAQSPQLLDVGFVDRRTLGVVPDLEAVVHLASHTHAMRERITRTTALSLLTSFALDCQRTWTQR